MKTMRVLSVLSLRELKRPFGTGIAFCVIHRWNSEARLPSSHDHGHPEVRLDCACMERATEDRESSTSVDRFAKIDGWSHGAQVRGSQSIDGPLASL